MRLLVPALLCGAFLSANAADSNYDLPIRERLRLAKKVFDVSPASPSETLRRLASVRPPGDADAAWVTAAA